MLLHSVFFLETFDIRTGASAARAKRRLQVRPCDRQGAPLVICDISLLYIQLPMYIIKNIENTYIEQS